MGIILLVLVIGALNLCLGYALAAHLGFGPPSLAVAREALLSGSSEREPEVPTSPQKAVEDQPPTSSSADAGLESLVQEVILPPDWKSG